MLTTRIEAWNVRTEPSTLYPDGRRWVAKATVRDERGRFDGATNRRGSVIEHPRP